jgi:hypothetical protein
VPPRASCRHTGGRHDCTISISEGVRLFSGYRYIKQTSSTSTAQAYITSAMCLVLHHSPLSTIPTFHSQYLSNIPIEHCTTPLSSSALACSRYDLLSYAPPSSSPNYQTPDLNILLLVCTMNLLNPAISISTMETCTRAFSQSVQATLYKEHQINAPHLMPCSLSPSSRTQNSNPRNIP